MMMKRRRIGRRRRRGWMERRMRKRGMRRRRGRRRRMMMKKRRIGRRRKRRRGRRERRREIWRWRIMRRRRIILVVRRMRMRIIMVMRRRRRMKRRRRVGWRKKRRGTRRRRKWRMRKGRRKMRRRNSWRMGRIIRARSSYASSCDLTADALMLERAIRANDPLRVKRFLNIHHDKFQNSPEVRPRAEPRWSPSGWVLRGTSRACASTTLIPNHHLTHPYQPYRSFSLESNSEMLRPWAGERRSVSLKSSPLVSPKPAPVGATSSAPLSTPPSVPRAVASSNSCPGPSESPKPPERSIFAELRRSSEIFKSILLNLSMKEQEQEEADVECCSKLAVNPNLPQDKALGLTEVYSRPYLLTLPVLFLAVVRGNPTIVYLLLKYGAAVNFQDTHGNTALHLAVARDNVPWDCVVELVENGAQVSLPNRRGVTAATLAPGGLLTALQQNMIDRSWPGETASADTPTAPASVAASTMTTNRGGTPARILKKLRSNKGEVSGGEEGGSNASVGEPREISSTGSARSSLNRSPDLIKEGLVEGKKRESENRKSRGKRKWRESTRERQPSNVSGSHRCEMYGPRAAFCQYSSSIPTQVEFGNLESTSPKSGCDSSRWRHGVATALEAYGGESLEKAGPIEAERRKVELSAACCLLLKTCLTLIHGVHDLQFTAMVTINKVIDTCVVYRLAHLKVKVSDVLQHPAMLHCGPKLLELERARIHEETIFRKIFRRNFSLSGRKQTFKDSSEELEGKQDGAAGTKRAKGKTAKRLGSVWRHAAGEHLEQVRRTLAAEIVEHEESVIVHRWILRTQVHKAKIIVSKIPRNWRRNCLSLFCKLWPRWLWTRPTIALLRTKVFRTSCLNFSSLRMNGEPNFFEILILDCFSFEFSRTPLSILYSTFCRYYTNHSTKYARYVKHHVARILVYLGFQHRVNLRFSVYDILQVQHQERRVPQDPSSSGFVQCFLACYPCVLSPVILLRLLLHRLLTTAAHLQRWKSCTSRSSFASAAHEVPRSPRSRASSTDTEPSTLRNRRKVNLTVDCTGFGSDHAGGAAAAGHRPVERVGSLVPRDSIGSVSGLEPAMQAIFAFSHILRTRSKESIHSGESSDGRLSPSGASQPGRRRPPGNSGTGDPRLSETTPESSRLRFARRRRWRWGRPRWRRGLDREASPSAEVKVDAPRDIRRIPLPDATGAYKIKLQQRCRRSGNVARGARFSLVWMSLPSPVSTPLEERRVSNGAATVHQPSSVSTAGPNSRRSSLSPSDRAARRRDSPACVGLEIPPWHRAILSFIEMKDPDLESADDLEETNKEYCYKPNSNRNPRFDSDSIANPEVFASMMGFGGIRTFPSATGRHPVDVETCSEMWTVLILTLDLRHSFMFKSSSFTASICIMFAIRRFKQKIRRNSLDDRRMRLMWCENNVKEKFATLATVYEFKRRHGNVPANGRRLFGLFGAKNGHSRSAPDVRKSRQSYNRTASVSMAVGCVGRTALQLLLPKDVARGAEFVAKDDADAFEANRRRADVGATWANGDVSLANGDVRLANSDVSLANDDVRRANNDVRLANNDVRRANGDVRRANNDVRLVNGDVRLANGAAGLAFSAQSDVGVAESDVVRANSGAKSDVFSQMSGRFNERWSRTVCSGFGGKPVLVKRFRSGFRILYYKRVRLKSFCHMIDDMDNNNKVSFWCRFFFVFYRF
ncbi:unnamed protein product [Nesidiocoris tenuis]|uniref:Uncharacterized protein n=1 Tax=Nesidiocoris tenuis TaxID=355587 RepID=A0A6H5GAS9_9HEMI|nr:unnamed protein product [Nesidiocoris tenuis]